MLEQVKISKDTYGEAFNVHSRICRVPKWQRLPTTAHPNTGVLALNERQDPL